MRFVFSGGLATLSHWGSMWLLILWGLPAATATAIGAAIGAVLNYLLQYHLTFRTSRPHRQAVPAYLLTCTIGWCANLGLFALLQYCGLAVVPAQGLTTVAVAVLNFWLYKRIVFHDGVQPPSF